MTADRSGARATSALITAKKKGSLAALAIMVERQWVSFDTSCPLLSTSPV
jgi:hypothetical protein